MYREYKWTSQLKIFGAKKNLKNLHSDTLTMMDFDLELRGQFGSYVIGVLESLIYYYWVFRQIDRSIINYAFNLLFCDVIL